MNRRQALKGGFLATVASLVPLPVLETALSKHKVDIVIDEDDIGTMRIDDGRPIHLSSLVLRKVYGFKGVKEWGNQLRVADVMFDSNKDACDFQVKVERR